MLLFKLSQPPQAWKFDLLSALIGAILALLLAFAVYQQRERIKRLGLKLWSPLVNLRNRAQASQEERYIGALQEALKELLLFTPADPTAIFQPPTFAAPPPLPASIDPKSDTLIPEPLTITFAHLTDGYPKLIITGPQASGRTMALAMLVWQTVQRAGKKRPYERFPIWIDLKQWKNMPRGQTLPPLERLVQLAGLFMPSLIPKWAMTHLRNEPSLILVDNWDILPPDERHVVARWIAEVSQSLPKSCWLVASGETGYGALVENGFVPLEIVPPSGETTVTALYNGWARLLKMETHTPSEEVLPTLIWATEAGASLLELTIRIIVYMQTQQLPLRPVDVLDRFLDNCIPTPNLGEGQADLVEQARVLTLDALSHLAKIHRLEGRAFSQQEIYDFIGTLLPDDAAASKLEGAVRRMLFDTHLLQREGKLWAPAHYVWDDFLTAWALTEDPIGADMAKTHLNDPTWALLLEFYAGLEDVTPLVNMLFNDALTYGNFESLLRAARWGILAPEDAPWRKSLMKVLAQTFTDAEIDKAMRLRIGHALALNGGEGARAFFIQVLRQPAVAIRAAALRGLGWTGSPREMPLFKGALQDPDLEIRQSAIKALGDMGTPGAARMLQDAMFEADEQLLPAIAEALSKTPEGLNVLKQAADDESLLIRRTAAQGLSQVNQPWAIEMLQHMAREDKEWVVRSAAEIGLNVIKEQTENQAVVPAPPAVDQMEWLITWAAKQGLGLGVGAAALAMLERAITQGDPTAKILGALTLMHIGCENHLALLEPLQQDYDVAVRHVAKYALQCIQKRYYVYRGA
ncbi:MAG TPA: HEAT repeat domain-containing protein [Anaerolineae bacterium]|nr:HEAT repeat domain-containing protein [Anaerolineae bacterium]HQK14306.1 HEAT repeat domain-containing protein [Anaerolineae bacterium]